MIIKYVNSNGAEIVLNSGNYLVGANDLRNFAWDYMATNRPSGFGGRVTFSRPVQEKTIIVGIKGNTAVEFNANTSALMALTEPDILNHTPGKLYLGNQYLTCYLATSSAVSVYARRQNWVSKELKIVVTEPFWHVETTQRFLAGAPETVVGGETVRWALRLPIYRVHVQRRDYQQPLRAVPDATDDIRRGGVSVHHDRREGLRCGRFNQFRAANYR